MGMALYEPLPFRNATHHGRVGDVAYFNPDGDYKWVCNAFDAEACYQIPNDVDFV